MPASWNERIKPDLTVGKARETGLFRFIKVGAPGRMPLIMGRTIVARRKKKKAGGELFLPEMHGLGYYNHLRCPRSSVVEHILGKEEVIGSIPLVGSIKNITEALYG